MLKFFRLDRTSLIQRIVLITVLFSLIAVLLVGIDLSATIAKGIFEQRRDRVLTEARLSRDSLGLVLDNVKDATPLQQQDAATIWMQNLRKSSEGTGRQAAIVPVENLDAISVISTDRSMLDILSKDLRDQVQQKDGIFWQSVTWKIGDNEVPAILVGTRVTVAGTGTYDLYQLYPLQHEQEALDLVQRSMLIGGSVLLVLLFGIAIVVGKVVTIPLQRTAIASERIAAGELETRLDVKGSDEVARLSASFNQMAQSLQEKVEDLTELSRLQQRFVSDVSHELRTPLTTIKIASSVLDTAKQDFPPDLKRSTELMNTQIKRFDVLLSDLLEISRHDAGAAELVAKEIDFSRLVQSTVDEVQPTAAQQGCTLTFIAKPGAKAGDYLVHLDHRRISRILRNLLFNAIEHGKNKPIEIYVAANRECVAVSVQDHGIGLDEAAVKHVFDRFWRADPSRARTLGGSGLGLSISMEDARLHGGELAATGEVGVGAVFRLVLPRYTGADLNRAPLPLAFDPFALAEEEK